MIDYSEIFDFSDKKFIQDELDCVAKQNLEIFEESIKETIRSFEEKYNECCSKESEMSDEICKIDNLIRKNENITYDKQKIELYANQYEYYIEREWINQQLRSLCEMLIINAYKNIEINIKSLIKIAYPNVNSKEFYKWESLNQFFKNKNIELSKIQGYIDIFSIKNLNNSLKHNGLINDEIKKLPEFQDDEEYDFVNLMNFYERVKTQIPIFLTELSEKIQNDLFKFSEDRISEIAKEYKLRMDENDLKIFIQKLSE